MSVGLSAEKKIIENNKSNGIPDEAQTRFQQATLLLKQGKTEDALDGFRQALDIAPNYTEALHETANCLHHLGRDNEARTYYSRALREIGDRLCEIGRYEESLGRYWVAISRYEEASKFYQPECMPEPVMNGDYEKIKQRLKKISHDTD